MLSRVLVAVLVVLVGLVLFSILAAVLKVLFPILAIAVVAWLLYHFVWRPLTGTTRS